MEPCKCKCDVVAMDAIEPNLVVVKCPSCNSIWICDGSVPCNVDIEAEEISITISKENACK